MGEFGEEGEENAVEVAIDTQMLGRAPEMDSGPRARATEQESFPGYLKSSGLFAACWLFLLDAQHVLTNQTKGHVGHLPPTVCTGDTTAPPVPSKAKLRRVGYWNQSGPPLCSRLVLPQQTRSTRKK